MPTNVFVPKFHTDEILEEIRECLEKGWTGLGFKTNLFEEKWKDFTGLPFAHFLNSNTSGLHLAVHMLKKKYNWNDNDEIITTPLTFVSTNHAILYERLKPVFADIDRSLCLDPNDVLNKITSKTRAVMYVGIGGNTGRLDDIAKICKERNLKLILDAAHMAGTKYYGKHVGMEADITVFSFQAVKNLPTSDSGMICCKEESMDEWVRKLSWLGISKDTYTRYDSKVGSYKWKYDVPDIGFKYHGNSIVASIGIVQLKYLENDNNYRNELSSLYDKLLENLNEVQQVKIAQNCVSSRHLYQIRISKRDEIMEYLFNQKIFPGVHYIDNTNYQMYAFGRGTCPNAARASEELISLPLHLNLTHGEVRNVVKELSKAIKRMKTKPS